MDTTEETYWEQEYTGLENQFFKGKDFWRAPTYALTGTPLFSVYQDFSARLPDHPNEHNTVFYLLPGSNDCFELLLLCSHFEHTDSEDLGLLTDFIRSSAARLTKYGNTGLELLDGTAEKIIILFCSPSDEVVSLLQNRGTRRTA